MYDVLPSVSGHERIQLQRSNVHMSEGVGKCKMFVIHAINAITLDN